MSEGRFDDFLPPGSGTMGGGRRAVQGAPQGRRPTQGRPPARPRQRQGEDEAGIADGDAAAVAPETLLTPEGEPLHQWIDRVLSAEEHARKSGTAYAISEHADRKLRQIKYAIDDLGLYKKRKTGLGNLQELGIELLYQAVVERRVLSQFDPVFAEDEGAGR